MSTQSTLPPDTAVSAQIVHDLETIVDKATTDILSRGGYAVCPLASILVMLLSGLLLVMRSGSEQSVRELTDVMPSIVRRCVTRVEMKHGICLSPEVEP